MLPITFMNSIKFKSKPLIAVLKVLFKASIYYSNGL